MSKSEFRIAEDVAELMNVFIKCQIEEIPLLIWQSMEDKRVLSEALIDEVVPDKKVIQVKVRLEKTVDLKRKQELFFFQSKLNLLFKGKIIQNQDKELLVKIYKKVYLKEKRRQPRFQFKSMEVLAQIQTYDALKETYKADYVKLLDVSEGGMAFEVSAQKATQFQKGDYIGLTRIHKVILPREIEGNVMHVTPVDDKENSFNKIIKVGVMFKQDSKLIKLVMEQMNGSA